MVLRKLVIAGVSGYACGKLYSHGKAHPEVAIPILEGAVVAGVCGSLLGLGISTHRNLSSYVHTVSLGANFALTTATFLGLRHWIMSHDHHVYSMTSYNVSANQKVYVASSFSGGITGTLFSLISWKGISPLLFNCLGGFSTGIIVQFCFNIFEQWRKRKAVELMYAEETLLKENERISMYHKFQRSWMEFWYRKSKAALLEQDILLLQDLIKEETEKLKSLDDQLAADHATDCSNNNDTPSSQPLQPTR